MDYEDGQNSSFNRRSFSPSKRGFFPGRRGGTFPSRRGFGSSRRGFRGGRNRGNFNNDRYFGRGGAHHEGSFVPRGRGFHHDGNFVPRGRGRGSPRSRRPFRGGPANRFPRENNPIGERKRNAIKCFKLINVRLFHNFVGNWTAAQSHEIRDQMAREFLADQFDGYEVNLALTKVGFLVFRKLLRYGNLDVMSTTMSRIILAVEFLSSNCDGSMVLIRIINCLANRLEKCHSKLTVEEVDKAKLREEITSTKDFICKLIAKVIENLGELIYEPNAEIVLRVILPMLLGKSLKTVNAVYWALRDLKFVLIPSAFPTFLESATQVMEEFDANRMLKNAPVDSLRAILYVLHDSNPDVCDRVIEKVFASDPFATDGDLETKKLPEAFTEPKYRHLVQNMLKMIAPPMFKKIFDIYQPYFATMATHPVAIIALSGMLRLSHKKKQILTVFAELKPVLLKIETGRSLALFASLAEPWMKHGCKQKILIKALKSAFGCKDGKSFVEFFLTKLFSKSPEDKIGGDEKFHASKLLELLLQCTESREVLTELLALDPDLLVKISMDRQLNNVMLVLLQFATDEEKTDVINKMMGKLAFVTCDEYGLPVVVEMWRCSAQPLRQSMAQELAKEFDTLVTHDAGRVVCKMFNLEELIKTPKHWTRHLGKDIENGTSNTDNDQQAQVGKSREVDSDDDDELLEAETDEEAEADNDEEAEGDEEETSDDDLLEEETDEESDDDETPEINSVNSKKRKMNNVAVTNRGPQSKKQKSVK